MVCLGKIGFINLGDDCGVDKTPSKKINVKVESSSSTNLNNSLKSIQSSQTNAVLNQIQNVAIRGSCCVPLQISQKLKAIVIDNNKMSVNFKTAMASQLTNDINKVMDGVEKSVNDILKGPGGTNLKAAVNVSLNKMNSQNKIANIISEKVSNTIANQGQNINIECGEEIPTPKPPAGSGLPDTGCYISQSFLYEQLANNIMETMMSDIIKDEKVDEIISKISQKNITPQLQKTGKFERTPMSWFESNIETIGLILLAGGFKDEVQRLNN
jgi:hypothetical protein